LVQRSGIIRQIHIGLRRLWRIHRTRIRHPEEALGPNLPEAGLESIFPPLAETISEIHKMPDNTRPRAQTVRPRNPSAAKPNLIVWPLLAQSGRSTNRTGRLSVSARLGNQQGYSTTSSAVATSDGRYGKANCLGRLEIDLWIWQD
jgi:hypothetical protein